MKKKRRIENRIIAVILCMAILFSQVNIADAADLNPSGTNTSQVVLSDETNMSNDEAPRNPNLRYRRKQVKTRKMTNRNRPVEMLKRNQQII